MSSNNYGRALPIPVVTMHRGREVKLVPKTEVAEHQRDGWKIVAGSSAKEVRS